MNNNTIANIHINCLGTLSFNGKFKGMRKTQDFIIYPIQKGDNCQKITIQSDTRIGTINLESGAVNITKAYPSGAYFLHMAFAMDSGKLEPSQLLILKANILGTASEKAGNNGAHVYCDNSNAINIFKGV